MPETEGGELRIAQHVAKHMLYDLVCELPSHSRHLELHRPELGRAAGLAPLIKPRRDDFRHSTRTGCDPLPKTENPNNFRR